MDTGVGGQELCRILAVDIADDKLAVAPSFGATHTINSATEDAAASIRALTGGRGAEYVFVTVGVGSAIDQGLAYARSGGTMVVVGMPPTGVMAEYDPGDFANRSQRIVGSKMGSARISSDIPALIKRYDRGELKLDELISGRFPLEDINDAIAEVRNRTALRNVIVF